MHPTELLEQSDVHPMSALPKMIQVATRELREIQQQLQATPDERTLSSLDSQALSDFKAAVDYVRQLLWVYIEAGAAKKGQNVNDAMRRLRLQRVTEMLQTIQEDVKSRHLAHNPTTDSFLHVVQEIADAAMEKHALRPAVGSKR
jgi:hypothetical protein